MTPQAQSLAAFFDLDSAAARKDGLAALEGTAALYGVKTLLTAAPHCCKRAWATAWPTR